MDLEEADLPEGDSMFPGGIAPHQRTKLSKQVRAQIAYDRRQQVQPYNGGSDASPLQPGEKLTVVAPDPLAPPKPDISLGKQLWSALGQESDFGLAAKFYERSSEDHGDRDPGFIPLQHMTPEEIANPTRYLDAISQQDLDRIRSKVREEQQAQFIMENGPLPGFVASGAAIMASPSTWLPVAGELSGVAKGAVALGTNALASSAIHEGLRLGANPDQTWKQTVASMMIDTTMGAVLGAGAGAIVGRKAAASAGRQAIVDTMNHVYPQIDPAKDAAESLSAAKNTIVPGVPDELTRVVGDRIMDTYTAMMKGAHLDAPGVTLATSQNPETRRIVHELIDTGIITKGEVKGMAVADTPLQNEVNLVHGKVYAMEQYSNAQWQKYKAAGGEMNRMDFEAAVDHATRMGDVDPNPIVDETAKWFRANVYTPGSQRAVEVGLYDAKVLTDPPKGAKSYAPNIFDVEAAQRGTRDASGRTFTQAIADHIRAEADGSLENMTKAAAAGREKMPQLEKAANEATTELARLRKVVEDTQAEVDRLTILRRESKTAEEKLVYDQSLKDYQAQLDKAVEARDEFRKSSSSVRGAPAKAATAAGKIGAQIAETQAMRDTADQIAQDILTNMAKAPRGRLMKTAVQARGVLKERTLDIPYTVLQPWLKHNSVESAAHFINTVYRDAAFMERFGMVDSQEMLDTMRKDITERLQKTADEALQAATEKAQSITDVAKREAALKKAQEASEKTMADGLKNMEGELLTTAEIWNRVRGVHTLPIDPKMIAFAKAGSGLRAATYMATMGSVLFAQMMDPFTMMMREGFQRGFGTIIGDLGRGFRGLRLSMKEGKQASTCLEWAQHQRTDHLLDFAERYGSNNRWERGLKSATNFFTRATGMTIFTDLTKGWAAMSAMTRIMESSRKLVEAGASSSMTNEELLRMAESALGANDLRRMAQSRLTPRDLLSFARQSSKWEDLGHAIIAHHDTWDDLKAARKFEGVLNHDVESAIITPNVGDAPLWTNTEVGKLFAQFKKFTWASQHRIVVAGLQYHDANTLGAALGMVGMGAFSLYLRDVLTPEGRKRIERRTDGEWVRDTLDRSGIFGAAFELANIPSAFGIPMTDWMAGQRAQRDFGKPPVERLSPAASKVADFAKVMGDIMRGSATGTTVHRARSLLPGNNHFAFGRILDAIEPEATEAMNLPPRKQ